MTVRLCAPTVLKLTFNVAVLVLPVPANVPVPNVVAPSIKVTVPVGLSPVVLAVRVTLWPILAVAKLLVRVVVVAVALTVTLDAVEVLAVSSASPA